MIYQTHTQIANARRDFLTKVGVKFGGSSTIKRHGKAGCCLPYRHTRPAKLAPVAVTFPKTTARLKRGLRVWNVECSYANLADVVGAINVLERGHRLLACGDGAFSASMKQEPTEGVKPSGFPPVGIPRLGY